MRDSQAEDAHRLEDGILELALGDQGADLFGGQGSRLHQ
jgi:hypothetical protein